MSESMTNAQITRLLVDCYDFPNTELVIFVASWYRSDVTFVECVDWLNDIFENWLDRLLAVQIHLLICVGHPINEALFDDIARIQQIAPIDQIDVEDMSLIIYDIDMFLDVVRQGSQLICRFYLNHISMEEYEISELPNLVALHKIYNM